MHNSRTSEEYELFRKWARDTLGCIDIGHSDSPTYGVEHVSKVVSEVLTQELRLLESGERARSYHKVTIPSDIRTIAAKTVFQHMLGLADIKPSQTVVFPQTSTALVKFAVMDAAARAQEEKGVHVEPEVWYPEGNFRYNHNVEGFTGVARRVIPVDKETFKITPATLEKTFLDAQAEECTPIALILELPNNPWMQVYTDQELAELVAVTERYELLIINDLYLVGTEELGLEQNPVAAVAKRKDLLITIAGVRRKYGLDTIGKSGFACSHNKHFIAELLARVKNIHVKHSELDYQVLLRVVGNLEGVDSKALRQSLSLNRERAEAMVEEVKGLRVIVKTQAGPFIVVGFSEELEDLFRKAKIQNGHEIAELFAVCGKVTVLPLYTMFTKTEGFRINVADMEDFKLGLEYMKNTIACLFTENEKGTLEEYIKVARNNIAEIYQNIHTAKKQETEDDLML